MKNIHLIYTDKPSVLMLDKDGLHWAKQYGFELFDDEKNYQHTGKQNIYITSDKEIKDGDWYYLPRTNSVHKCIEDPTELNLERRLGVAKIILTTDQDLINDGVQAIDDKFLEWFIKNPTCEFVDFHIEKYVNLTSDPKPIYKINIPKEKPKQTRTIVDELKAYFENTPADKIQSDWDETCKRTEGIESPTVSEFIEAQKQAQKQFMEQEIIRAAEQRYPFEVGYSVSDENIRIGELQDAYIEGAKEQAERMYSEEEVFSIIASLLHTPKLVENGSWEEIGDWFEQFKKK